MVDHSTTYSSTNVFSVASPRHFGHYGPGPDSPVWWLILWANLNHEIHHRCALAVYLRVLKRD